jgi:hypothetical protein
MRVNKIFLAALLLWVPLSVPAQIFRLPTANQALFQNGGEDRFFVATIGHTWTSGCFGCVRSSGAQMHEGLDIRCLQRDKRGEPIDPVMATADGAVVYMSDKPGLSNYGRYLVILHNIGGLEIYSLYAHLSKFAPGLKVGQRVAAGQPVAVMGHTGTGISNERSHVHFELNLFYTDHFSAWYKRRYPKEHDDHGIWNGQNLVGIDPRLILLEQQTDGAHFNLLNWLQHRTEVCRVLVRKTDFSWLRRYPMLIKADPALPREQIAGYEIALDYNGLPFELIPRSASQIKGAAKYQLVSVNEAEQTKNPCRRLVARAGSHWRLGNNGVSLLDMLTD